MGCLNGKLHRFEPDIVDSTPRTGRDEFEKSSPVDENDCLDPSSSDRRKSGKKKSISRFLFAHSSGSKRPGDGDERSRLAGLFGRRYGSPSQCSNSSNNSNSQNGSALHPLGSLLENGNRSGASPRVFRQNVENGDSPLTPDRLHKNFQERLVSFSTQVSRNNQKLTDSQLEFFRMLDEKIAQGGEYDNGDA